MTSASDSSRSTNKAQKSGTSSLISHQATSTGRSPSYSGDFDSWNDGGWKNEPLFWISRTPPYGDTAIGQPVWVQFQLIRPSDGRSSEARAFQYLPIGKFVIGYAPLNISSSSFALHWLCSYISAATGARSADFADCA